MIKIRKKHKIGGTLILILLIISLLPSTTLIPVKNATSNDWNQNTFWYEPWGVSGVHKGIDIFAAKSTNIISPAPGLVLYTGEIDIGGKIVITIDAKLRLHYFAHLEEISTHSAALIRQGKKLGTVGDSGNALGKQPHLHYSVITLLPYIWRVDNSTQGWKKMFYLNPADYFIN